MACEDFPCCGHDQDECEELMIDMDDEYDPRCPACGQNIQFCQGHGAIGDPNGAWILVDHDRGDHSKCHPSAKSECAW